MGKSGPKRLIDVLDEHGRDYAVLVGELEELDKASWLNDELLRIGPAKVTVDPPKRFGSADDLVQYLLDVVRPALENRRVVLSAASEVTRALLNERGLDEDIKNEHREELHVLFRLDRVLPVLTKDELARLKPGLQTLLDETERYLAQLKRGLPDETKDEPHGQRRRDLIIQMSQHSLRRLANTIAEYIEDGTPDQIFELALRRATGDLVTAFNHKRPEWDDDNARPAEAVTKFENLQRLRRLVTACDVRGTTEHILRRFQPSETKRELQDGHRENDDLIHQDGEDLPAKFRHDKKPDGNPCGPICGTKTLLGFARHVDDGLEDRSYRKWFWRGVKSEAVWVRESKKPDHFEMFVIGFSERDRCQSRVEKFPKRQAADPNGTVDGTERNSTEPG